MQKEGMLSLCDPVHLILSKHDSDGTISLVSSHSLEWRKTLTCEKTAVTSRIELMGIGTLKLSFVKAAVVILQHRVAVLKDFTLNDVLKGGSRDENGCKNCFVPTTGVCVTSIDDC